jgi:hypothetical protein
MATKIEEEEHVVKLLLRPVVKCVAMTLLELLPCLLGVSMCHFEAGETIHFALIKIMSLHFLHNMVH